MSSPETLQRPEREEAGELATTPLARILLQLHAEQATGTLLIYAANEALHAAVRLESGDPCTALAEDAAEHNLATLLLPVFGWSEGRFEFVRGQDLVGDHASLRGRIDPFPLLAAAARGCTREKEIEHSVGVIDRHLIQKSRSLDFNRYAFTPQERLVLAGIEPGMVSLDEVRKLARVPENVLRRVLYVLWLSGGIALLPKQRMVSGTVRRASLPAAREEVTVPVPSSIAPAAAPSMPAPPAAPASVAPAPAAPASVKPGRPSSPGTRTSLSVPSQAATLPPARITASHRPSSQSTSSLPAAPATDARARRDQTEALWRKAETLATRGDFENALQTARAAVKLSPTRPEHDAMLGWIIMQHGGGNESVHDHVWRCLDRAFKRDPLCEQVLYYKGLVLNLMGETQQAQAHFQRVLLVKPGHAGATREVRIFEMRKDHARTESNFLRRLLTGRPKPE
jgi:hypothetical protein